MIRADLNKARFVLTGAEFAPPDLAQAATEDRAAYWRQVGLYARDAKYRELHRGIGVDGEKLKPRKRPRHDHAGGPVLLPHYSGSRFRTALRWDATPDGVVLWWRYPFGRIVGYHARGEVPGAPVRNVVGLTSESRARVAKQSREWWAARVAEGRMGERAYTVAAPIETKRPVGDPLGPVGPWKTPGARPKDSIFARPEPIRPIEPTLYPTGGLPSWDLTRVVMRWMDRAARGAVKQAEIDRLMKALSRTQLTGALQEVLKRLGVKEVPERRAKVLELIERQITERARNPLGMVG